MAFQRTPARAWRGPSRLVRWAVLCAATTGALAGATGIVGAVAPSAVRPVAKVVESDQLNGIACPAATVCMAVGEAGPDDAAARPLAEYWNGASFRAVTVPVPKGAGITDLSAVSCPTTSSCTAVGYTTTAADEQIALAEAWNGKTWAVLPAPVRAGSLASVSCTSASACVAVGADSTINGPLSESWNGKDWTVLTTPYPKGSGPPEGFATLAGVACADTGSCEAVGAYSPQGKELYYPFALSWNGSAWAVQSVPHTTGTLSNWPAGVSCASSGACALVGTVEGLKNVNQYPNAAYWDGKGWTATSATVAKNAQLAAVSCTSASTCLAVGGVWNAAGTSSAPFAESWNGKTWTVLKPASSSFTFIGVAHTSTTRAIAVGYLQEATGDDGTLAELWNGTTWTVLPTPNP